MALSCYNSPATYTAATTATLLADPSGAPAVGDYVLVEWDAADEGSSYTITVYTDGTITDGGSVSGKVGAVVRIEAGDNGRRVVPVNGVSRVHVAASSAWGTARVKVGRW